MSTLKQKELWSLIHESRLDANGKPTKSPSQDIVTSNVCIKLGVKVNDFLKTDIKNEIRLFMKKKDIEAKKSAKDRTHILQLADGQLVIFYENSPLLRKDDDEPQAKKRRSSGTTGGYKRFEDLKNKQKLNLTDDIMKMITEFKQGKPYPARWRSGVYDKKSPWLPSLPNRMAE